jgi:hypothetical protein
MATVRLGSHTLSAGDRPYTTVEIGVNHEGDIILANRVMCWHTLNPEDYAVLGERIVAGVDFASVSSRGLCQAVKNI